MFTVFCIRHSINRYYTRAHAGKHWPGPSPMAYIKTCTVSGWYIDAYPQLEVVSLCTREGKGRMFMCVVFRHYFKETPQRSVRNGAAFHFESSANDENAKDRQEWINSMKSTQQRETGEPCTRKNNEEGTQLKPWTQSLLQLLVIAHLSSIGVISCSTIAATFGLKKRSSMSINVLPTHSSITRPWFIIAPCKAKHTEVPFLIGAGVRVKCSVEVRHCLVFVAFTTVLQQYTWSTGQQNRGPVNSQKRQTNSGNHYGAHKTMKNRKRKRCFCIPVRLHVPGGSRQARSTDWTRVWSPVFSHALSLVSYVSGLQKVLQCSRSCKSKRRFEYQKPRKEVPSP